VGEPDAQLEAGRVGRAHGLDGSFYVTGPQARLLLVGTPVGVAGATAAIVRRAGTDARPIVRLEGVDDRASAEALRGFPLTISRQQAPALAPGEWWSRELESCVVSDRGRRIGTVARVLELPSCEALEVQLISGGAPLLVQILNRNTGTLIASVNAGGGDQLEYDAGSNRYYNAGSRWTASGNAAVNGTCSAASPCTPVLSIIDAGTHAVLAQLPAGNNAHSVAVDPASGHVFMPISSASAPAGCSTCAANGFINAGVAIYTIH